MYVTQVLILSSASRQFFLTFSAVVIKPDSVVYDDFRFAFWDGVASYVCEVYVKLPTVSA